MRAAIVSMGSISSKMTAEAMQKYFSQVDQLDVKEFEVNLGKDSGVLYAGKPLEKYDCVYLKGSGRYANLLRAIANMLGDQTYIPIKPIAYTTGHDKLLTHIVLHKHGVPQPMTYIAATSMAAKKIIKKMPMPVVLKLPSGTHGKGVMLADSHSSANSMIDALAALKQPFLVQEYLETDGTDTRAFVIDDEVVAAMSRTAVTGEKRANIHAGGKGKSTILSAQDTKIAIKAAKAVGAEICGVDMLATPRGARVIEVNVSPGLQGITKVTGVNIADKIAKFFLERAKAFKEGKTKAAVTEITPEVPKERKEIITSVDFRGERILLPTIATKVTKLSEDDEVLMKVAKGHIEIDKIRKKNESTKEEE